MKNNKRHVVKKRLHEIDTKKNYSGEASPYWDHVLHQQRAHSDVFDGINEDALANPDVLAAESAVNHRALTERGELMSQAIHETMSGLTSQQQTILTLMRDGVWLENQGQLLYSEQAIATVMGISRSTVHTVLARLKTKIRRRYEILMTAKE